MFYVDVTMFEPNSEIYIMCNKNIDPSYSHVYRVTKENDTEYFNKLTSKLGDNCHVIRNCTPVRDQYAPYIRLPFNPIEAQNANYMFWRNKSGNRGYYYAFITDVMFVNINTVYIKAEIDVFATYLPMVDIKPVIVERSHSYQNASEIDKWAFDKFLYENIPTDGNVVVKRHNDLFEFMTDVYNVLGMSKEDNQPQPLVPYMYDPLTYYGYDNTQGGLTEMESVVKNQPQNIVTAFICPKFIATRTEGNRVDVFLGQREVFINFDRHVMINGYEPRNAKVLRYPYRFIRMIGEGKTVVIKYEKSLRDFYADSIYFIVSGSGTQGNVIAYLCPNIVDGKPAPPAGTYPFAPDTYVSISSFPNLALNVSAWDSYWSGGGTLKLISSIISAISGSASYDITTQNRTSFNTHVMANTEQNLSTNLSSSGSTNIVLAGLTMATSFANIGLGLGQLAYEPAQKVTYGANFANFVMNACKFYLEEVSITQEQAKILDDYFDTYGYLDLKMKTVDVNICPHWCYWKTTAPCFFSAERRYGSGSGRLPLSTVPAYALLIMNNSIQRGVTFWNIDDDLGDYGDEAKHKENHNW